MGAGGKARRTPLAVPPERTRFAVFPARSTFASASHYYRFASGVRLGKMSVTTITKRPT